MKLTLNNTKFLIIFTGSDLQSSGEKPTLQMLHDEPKKLSFNKGLLNIDSRQTIKTKNQSSDRSGPLKAFLPTIQKSASLKAELNEKTLCRSLETPKIKLKSTNNNMSQAETATEDQTEEMERLFDDYLLSELVRQNSERNFEQTSAKIDAEVTMMWMGLEDLRRQVIEKEDLNLKLKKLLELSNNVDGDISIFRPFAESDSFSDANLVELSNSLEHSRHHLQVIGAKISSDNSTSNELQRKLESNMPAFEGSTNRIEADAMTNLQENLAAILKGYEECKKSAEKAENMSLECSSLRLSQQQMVDNNGRQKTENFLDLLKVPSKPEVRLVDL